MPNLDRPLSPIHHAIVAQHLEGAEFPAPTPGAGMPALGFPRQSPHPTSMRQKKTHQ